jgi:hypothetical protein
VQPRVSTGSTEFIEVQKTLHKLGLDSTERHVRGGRRAQTSSPCAP